MSNKHWQRIICLGGGLIFCLTIAVRLTASARQTNFTKLRITVSGKKSGSDVSVAGADVLVRSSNGDFEANPTTDASGVASVSDVPFGKVLIQVTAAGWKTFGHTYDLNKKEQTVAIDLKPAEGAAPSPSPTPEATPTPTPTQ